MAACVAVTNAADKCGAAEPPSAARLNISRASLELRQYFQRASFRGHSNTTDAFQKSVQFRRFLKVTISFSLKHMSSE